MRSRVAFWSLWWAAGLLVAYLIGSYLDEVSGGYHAGWRAAMATVSCEP